MDTDLVCDVCQSTNFFEENGQYWCLECNTMSQHVTAVLVSEIATNAPEVHEDSDEAVETTSGGRGGAEDKELTSYELLTKVLRGLASELIDLGVAPELYKVSKVLWLTYLKKCGILNKNKQPTLPATLNARDVEILYGVQGVSRRKLITGSSREKRSRSPRSPASSTSTLSKSRRQRKLMQQLILEEEGNENTIQSIHSPWSTPQSSRHSSDYESEEDKIRDIKLVKGGDKFLKQSRGAWKANLKSRRLMKTVKAEASIESRKMHIGAIDVLSVLWLSLRYTESSHIQLGDFYRLVTDGYLRLDDLERFVPEKYRNYLCMRYWFKSVSRKSFIMRYGTTCGLLEMSHIRTCDVKVIIRRYVAELELPEDILQYTDKLCHLTACPTSRLVPLTRLVPEYDLMAMAIILVTLKALFGMDDSTEVELSNVAKTINRKQSSSEPGAAVQFQYADWAEHIVCRNSAIASAHYVSFESTYTRLTAHRLAARTFVSNGMKSSRSVKWSSFGRSKKLKPILQSGLDSVAAELEKTGAKDLEPPLTPPLALGAHEAYLPQWRRIILEKKSEEIDPKAREILERDFTQTSLDYLNSTKFVELCSRLGLSVVLQEGRSRLSPSLNSVSIGMFLPGRTAQPKTAQVLVKVTPEEKKIREEIDDLDIMLGKELSSDSDSEIEESEARKSSQSARKTRQKSGKSSKSTEGEDSDDDSDTEESGARKSKSAQQASQKSGKSSKSTEGELTLLIPWQQYWVTHHPTLVNMHNTRYKYSYKKSRQMSRSIASLCPINFVWVLNMCASIVRCQPYHLYASVCSLEQELFRWSSEKGTFWPSTSANEEQRGSDGSS
ncbi:TATA box-binding protein-associated factor RNA polymerase I subunit B-like [Diaphorina citri]|uniref:TATA box-binding protein-associated factor RNA polymerase I subunit B-like n=1 Tax=Diaphorina citri TaxID=121845 RepID=A0A3Q0IZU7_DIACI|nr:TATA box-binding protein-associated factor RNA polymerase I subunit B-like [Diaphorina citri]XP_026680214.1 TATA box-binding protein-associated factor RNA polymerase I subunit B-like [Diaphorina citri]XP_026680215.1 TATA box-binding protein-associated factor RNA polymerase I subunit B-like [Diaphorina citri]